MFANGKKKPMKITGMKFLPIISGKSITIENNNKCRISI